MSMQSRLFFSITAKFVIRRIRTFRTNISCIVLSCCLALFAEHSADGQTQDAQDRVHLFILSGQSNMQGMDPDISFRPRVQTRLGADNVLVVKDAMGGQPIRRWYRQWQSPEGAPAPDAGDLYQRLMSRVQARLKDRSLASVTFVWMQGERDAREAWGAVYRESLEGLWRQVQTDFPDHRVHFVLGRLSDFDLKNKRYPDWTRVREAQVAFAESSPWARWVNTDDLNDGLNRAGQRIADDLHYSVEGYRTLGERFADAALAMLQAATQRVDNAKPQPDRVEVFKQAGDVELKLHLFVPDGWMDRSPVPTVVFFFGGGWVSGSPSQFYAQSQHLAARGMLAICAEYRVQNRHGTSPPVAVQDAKSAMRWIRGHARDLNIDAKQIVAAGGSAGGHLAAATATLTEFNDPQDDLGISCRPQALVLFNPVIDNSPEGYGNDRVQDVWRQFSPLHNLDAEVPPTLFFLGTQDKLIPVTTAEAFQSKLQQLEVRCDLELYEGAAHGFFNRGEAYADTLEKTDQFLSSLGLLCPAFEPNTEDANSEE